MVDNIQLTCIFVRRFARLSEAMMLMQHEEDRAVMRRVLHQDMYNHALYWIVNERAGAGGWPPVSVDRVCGWTIVRMLAELHGKTVRQVAQDVVDTYKLTRHDRNGA